MGSNARNALVYYVIGVVAMLSGMAALLYAVGAFGLFGDPPHTRVVDGVVAVVLIVFCRLMVKLSGRVGDPRARRP